MDIKELMVGDLFRVNRDGLCIKKDTIVQVRGIDGDNKFEEKGLVGCANCHPLDKMQFDGGIWLDYLDPISLTPEILEKNEWKHDPSLNRCITSCELQVFSTQLMSWDSKYHCLEIRIRNREKLYPYNIPELLLIIPCDYVHELQHALRLCGIDKEIVL